MEYITFSNVAKKTMIDSIWDYDSTVVIENRYGETKNTSKIMTNTTMLCHLPQGCRFKIGDLEFIKLETFKNGTTMILCMLKEYGKYGKNVDYPNSYARSVIYDTMLPIIEDNIGASYIKPHYTDYTTLKLGRYYTVNVNSNKNKLTILERIGLLSCDDYLKYKELIPKTVRRGWLSNRVICSDGLASTMRDGVCGASKCHVHTYIRPVLTVDSSRIVKTRVLSTYSA